MKARINYTDKDGVTQSKCPSCGSPDFSKGTEYATHDVPKAWCRTCDYTSYYCSKCQEEVQKVDPGTFKAKAICGLCGFKNTISHSLGEVDASAGILNTINARSN